MRLKLSQVIYSMLTVLIIMSIASESNAETWTDKIKWQGDFRYRHELIDEEDKEQRNRHRLRARIGMFAEVTDDLRIGFQMTSGSDDPVSNNQTLGDGFSTKNLGIDFAYFAWTPSALNGLRIHGGKFKNPWYKPGSSELIWDSDLNPEGLAVKYNHSHKVMDLFAHAGYFWIEERKNDDDSILIGGQAGLKIKASKDTYLILGMGNYRYQNTKGFEPFSGPEDSFYNSVDNNGNYALDYNEQEIFVELGGKIFGKSTSIFGNHVVNTDSERGNDWGYLMGITFGKCKTPFSYALRYNYRHLEKDAVIGAFTDSDFGGGGTDAKGHEAGIDFQIANHVKTGISYFVNEKNVDKSKDYKRIQIDLSFKF